MLSSLFTRPASFAGLAMSVVDAQQQRRTIKDVRGPWIRPKPMPSKRAGRKGTRRAWKRANPPRWSWLYREPTDVIVFQGRAILTPHQYRTLEPQTLWRAG